MAKNSNAEGKRKTKIAVLFFLTLSMKSSFKRIVIMPGGAPAAGMLGCGSRPDQIPFTKLTCDYFLLNCLSMLAANSSGFRSPAKRD